MPHTNEEIKFCKRLHEIWKARGELPEIRKGDWYISGRETFIALSNTKALNKPGRRDMAILLLFWERCREMLREKGWTLTGHAECPHGIYVSFSRKSERGDEIGRGQTDLECALRVMVAVAEEEA